MTPSNAEGNQTSNSVDVGASKVNALANADLRDAISEALTIYKPAPFKDAEPLKERRASEKQIDKLVTIFQAREQQLRAEAGVNLRKDNDFIKALKRDVQQQLLSELLGELPKKKAIVPYDPDVHLTEGHHTQIMAQIIAQNTTIDQVVSAIERYREGL